jgi:hypothetical protein
MNVHYRNNYLALIEQIAELQRRKLALQKKQKKLQDRIRKIHAELLLEIGTKKDEKGKLVYSNEHLRGAALILRLDEHQDFLDLLEKRRSLDHEISEIAIEHNKLVDRKNLFMAELGISTEFDSEKYPNVH